MTTKTKAYDFPLSLRWLAGRRTLLSVQGKDDARGGAPPEFKGGVEGVWSPEDLLVGSIASCFAVTLLRIADQRAVPLRGLDVDASGHVDAARRRAVRVHRGRPARRRRHRGRLRGRGGRRRRGRRAGLPRRVLARLPRADRARRPRRAVAGGSAMSTAHPSASFSSTLRVRLENRPGTFAGLAEAIGDAGGLLGAIDLVRVERGTKIRDVTVLANDASTWSAIAEAVHEVPGVEVVNVSDRTFLLHLGGKIEVTLKNPLKTRDDLSMAYTPGVARVSSAIAEDPVEGLEPDDQAEHGRRRQRRHGGARARRHRARGARCR